MKFTVCYLYKKKILFQITLFNYIYIPLIPVEDNSLMCKLVSIQNVVIFISNYNNMYNCNVIQKYKLLGI